jgi:hypothetical protein
MAPIYRRPPVHCDLSVDKACRPCRADKKKCEFKGEGIRAKKSRVDEDGIRAMKSRVDEDGIRAMKSRVDEDGIRAKKSRVDGDTVAKLVSTIIRYRLAHRY